MSDEYFQKDTKNNIKFKNESEELSNEKYAVTLTGHYEKTISVYADTPEQAAEKVKIILFDTDLISFSEEDFVCGEAKIEDADKEDGKEKDMPDEDEDECMNHEDCSGCPYLCPACGECLCEYED